MSKFDDLFGKTENRPVGRQMDMVLDCLECDAEAFDVTYYQVDHILKFICTAGHRNFIEDFKVVV